MSRVRSNNYDFPRFVDFYARDMHTGRSHGFDRPGHVLLPECGGRASHCDYREVCLWPDIVLVRQPVIVCLIVCVFICEVGGSNLVSPRRPPRNGTARKELEIRAGHKPLDPGADLVRLAAML